MNCLTKSDLIKFKHFQKSKEILFQIDGAKDIEQPKQINKLVKNKSKI